jgi:O-antigen/teichoic acid export membrane protein
MFLSLLKGINKVMLAKLNELKNNAGFRRYFANTSWLFGEKILRMGVGLFVGVWVARYLGPEQFGLFSYVQSFVGLFAFIATLGLDSIIVRELVQDESRRDVLIGTAFWLKLIGGFWVLAVITITVNFIPNDHATNLLVFIVTSATIFQCFNVIDFYFQSKVLGKYIVLANVISFLLSTIVKIALILTNAPLIYFAWSVVFDSVILSLGFVYYYRYTKHQLTSWRWDTEIAKELLRNSWPLILSSIAIAIYLKIDQVMIKEMMSNEAVGQYAAATRISEAWYFIPVVIASSLFPSIINAKKQSKELYYARLQKLYDIMVWVAIVIAMPMTLLSNWVVLLLYGGAYRQAGSVLMIHIWAGVFVSFGVVKGKWLLLENMLTYGMICTCFGALSNIVLNLLLINKMGIKGSAVATFVSYGISTFFLAFFYPKDRRSIKMFLKAFIIERRT